MSTYPNVAVVGARFRGADAVALCRTIALGTELRLKREPDNPYDPNAIKVMFHDQHIGYVERGQAAWIADDLDQGKTAVAIVTDRQENKTVVPIVEITVS